MKSRWTLSWLAPLGVCSLLFLAGCPAGDAADAKTPVLGLASRTLITPAAIAPTNNEVLVGQVLKLINERRVRIGLNELPLNPILTQMAEKYAAEMIERNFFSHEDPDGEGPGERAYKEGYVFLSVGENLAAGQETAEQVVSEWMASPEHRDMILGTQWQQFGIGVRIGGELNVYWVLEFGNPP